MKVNHVIKILILLLVLSCSSNKQIVDDDFYVLINKELIKASNTKEPKNYLKFNQNKRIKGFLVGQANGYKYKSSIIKEIGSDVYQELFDYKEIKHMLSQLELDSINPNQLILNNSKLIYHKDENYVKTDLDQVLDYSRHYIYLSYPVFTNNAKYAIISSANGLRNGMQGGINIYKRQGKKWISLSTVDQWTE